MHEFKVWAPRPNLSSPQRRSIMAAPATVPFSAMQRERFAARTAKARSAPHWIRGCHNTDSCGAQAFSTTV